MTLCPLLEEDEISAVIGTGTDVFPTTKDLAETGERVADLRYQTSWTKSLLPSEEDSDTVHPIECLEVLLVNTLAPFTLLKCLCKPLCDSRGNVVNVCSREGVFSRVKQAEHFTPTWPRVHSTCSHV